MRLLRLAPAAIEQSFGGGYAGSIRRTGFIHDGSERLYGLFGVTCLAVNIGTFCLPCYRDTTPSANRERCTPIPHKHAPVCDVVEHCKYIGGIVMRHIA